MSKTTLRALGCLPDNFPEVAKLKVGFFKIHKLLLGKQVQEDVAAIYLGGERSQLREEGLEFQDTCKRY